MINEIDIQETELHKLYPEAFKTLLRDHTRFKKFKEANKEMSKLELKQHVDDPCNLIIWATDDYAHLGEVYGFEKPIIASAITGDNGGIIQPRCKKSITKQSQRVKDKAEVFTPSWVCNAQNNLIDDAWFGRTEVFNTEIVTEDGTHSWVTTESPISFDGIGKTWRDYVCDIRLEITCGEAPYLASRYDTVSGLKIDVNNRIGLLDRKLRIISENVDNSSDWIFWAKVALSSIYGYEWQGDNLLLAREALLFTVIDFYEAKFQKRFPKQSINGLAYIISWNLWQMDGLRCVIPNSCNGQYEIKSDLFATETVQKECLACKRGELTGHIGIQCYIVEWSHKGSRVTKQKEERFINVLTSK